MAEFFIYLLSRRDLKPENIFLKWNEPQGNQGYPTVKIGDFGLSKLVVKKNDFKNEEFKSTLGSTFYMAPEFYINEQKSNCKIDVFALG